MKKFNTFQRISRRLLKMPKGDKGVACKSPGKPETDVEARAIASLAEAIDRHTISEVNTKATDSRPTPSDGEHR